MDWVFELNLITDWLISLLLYRTRRHRYVGLWSLRTTLVLVLCMLATLTRKQQNSLRRWFRYWCSIAHLYRFSPVWILMWLCCIVKCHLIYDLSRAGFHTGVSMPLRTLRCETVKSKCYYYYNYYLPSVLWHCWLGIRKSIWPVKNWVMKCH